MSKHIIQKKEPKDYRIPTNAPEVPKFKTIIADPPWSKNQGGNYGAIKHYDLMTLDRIKNMPVADLADENAHLWLWVTNSNVDEGLDVIKSWGFTYRDMFHWIKPRMGLGYYLRNATETALFATRGKAPVKFRGQMNWAWLPVTAVHSEKPREVISVIERVSPGPYCELFCRKRPASCERWYAWGDGVLASHYHKAGADFFIPGYPVPKYSFEDDNDNAANKTDDSGSSKEEKI